MSEISLGLFIIFDLPFLINQVSQLIIFVWCVGCDFILFFCKNLQIFQGASTGHLGMLRAEFIAFLGCLGLFITYFLNCHGAVMWGSGFLRKWYFCVKFLKRSNAAFRVDLNFRCRVLLYNVNQVFRQFYGIWLGFYDNFHFQFNQKRLKIFYNDNRIYLDSVLFF